MVMRQVEWKKKHLIAFKKYLKGDTLPQIASDLEIDRKTVYRWEIRGNWKEHLDKQTTELIKRTNSEILDEKERSLKLIKAAESYWAKSLQEGTLKKTGFGDLAALQRAKWDILTPRNTMQFNFMKNETQINEPNYFLKIEKPNDNTNAMEAEQEAIRSLANLGR
jgi:hypothetical protein